MWRSRLPLETELYVEDKGRSEEWVLPMIPPPSCVQPQDSQVMLIYWQKQGPLLCDSMLVWNTPLKQDISLFTGAHFSKVMARKIWKSLKGNSGCKAIIHVLLYFHCHHCWDKLRCWVTSLLYSHYSTVQIIIKCYFKDFICWAAICSYKLHTACWEEVSLNHYCKKKIWHLKDVQLQFWHGVWATAQYFIGSNIFPGTFLVFNISG